MELIERDPDLRENKTKKIDLDHLPPLRSDIQPCKDKLHRFLEIEMQKLTKDVRNIIKEPQNDKASIQLTLKHFVWLNFIYWQANRWRRRLVLDRSPISKWPRVNFRFILLESCDSNGTRYQKTWLRSQSNSIQAFETQKGLLESKKALVEIYSQERHQSPSDIELN